MKKFDIIQTSKTAFLITETEISLRDTFLCGQCFRWKEIDGRWIGAAFGKAVAMTQKENSILIENTTRTDVEDLWCYYLDLYRDYSDVAKPFVNDAFITSAAEFGKGIHILAQEKIEALISFIISSNNNIKRISKTVDAFCSIYGKQIPFENRIIYAFPDADDLKKVTMTGLSEIRAGFRDRYILEAVERLRNDNDCLERIGLLSTEDARRELMTFKGIGPKVADCILLFSYGRTEVFPKDVWINRVTKNIYGESFDEKAFGKNAGIIQQYMFHYGRSFPEKLCVDGE